MEKGKSAAVPAVQIRVISDGKAGHLNQSLGLAEALCRLCPEATLQQEEGVRGAAAVLKALLPARRDPQAPALVIGAGHGTHARLLHWRRRGSRAIVLMRPSLPLRCFDLCIEPLHDGGMESERCWLTRGALNRMHPAAQRSDVGVILVGGPSPHYQWDSAALLGQLTKVCRGDRPWVLSTSRRTPEDFLPALRELALPGLEVHDIAALPPGWLLERLPAAPVCWATPDSVSMVYEALTAGCAVGLFELPAEPGSRIASGIESLLAQGLCRSFADYEAGQVPEPMDPPLAEADRIAARIVAKGWLA